MVTPKMKPGTVPKAGTIKKRCTAIGAWAEYLKRREELKTAGQLQPREAACRAYSELKIEQRYFDQISRQTRADILGKPGPLTVAEMQEVRPGYTPVAVTAKAEIGGDVLTFQEQVAWVQRWIARVKNGESPPTRFPNEATLFWFQRATEDKRILDNLVPRLERQEDDQVLQDNARQFDELGRQIQDALKEVGRQLGEYEAEFWELVAT